MNRISFQDTHVYPGCLALFFFKIIPGDTIVTAVAEFSDGAVASAEVTQENSGEVIVDIDSYTTTHGTHIPKKAWRLRYNDAEDSWKVTAKM